MAALLRPAIVCLALAALASCSGNSTYAPPAKPYTYTPSPAPGGPLTAADLDGRAYTSTSVDGKTLIHRTSIRVGFRDSTMAVSAGCNTMTGPFEVAGGTLRWTTPPAATQKGCNAALTRQDHWVASAFTSGLQITGDPSNTLRLSNPTVTINLGANSG